MSQESLPTTENVQAAKAASIRVSRPGPGCLHLHVIRDAEADRWLRLTDRAAAELREQVELALRRLGA